MQTLFRSILLSLGIAAAATSPLTAQAPAEAPENEESAKAAVTKVIEGLDWKTEGSGAIGSMAEIQIPQGYRFTGSSGTTTLMKLYGNLTDGSELGYISPSDMKWFAVFDFEDCGYVKDDEKDKLDADKILSQMREGQEEANKELKRQGLDTLELLGWKTPPFYNPTTHNLEWAIRLKSSDGGEVVNYKTKLLGRHGVMNVVLVCDESEMPTVVPAYQELLKGYAFQKDQSYAAFQKGDKIAEYGLTGLIVGGGLLVAAKSGLLTKLLKPILIGLLAVGAFLKRIFTGRKNESI